MRKRIYLTLLGVLCGMGAFAQEVVTLQLNGQGQLVDADTVQTRQDSLKKLKDTLRVEMDPLQPTMDSLRLLYESMLLPHDTVLPLDTLKAKGAPAVTYDSLATFAGDGGQVLPDSLREEVGLLQLEDRGMPSKYDSIRLADDSLRMAYDLMRAPQDTLRLTPDSLQVASDSIRAAGKAEIKVADASNSEETAAKAVRKKPAKPKESPAVRSFYKSLNEMSASYFAYFRLWDNLDVPMPRRTRPNPGFYKLFVPPTYYEAPIRELFRVNWNPDQPVPTAVDSLLMGKPDTLSDKIYSLPDLETLAAADRWSNRILRNFYAQHPDRLVNNELYLKDLKPLEDEMIVRAPRKEKFRNFLQPEPMVENLNGDNELLVLRPNFWTHKGNGYLQFTQHYISDNWYKGGESTNALLGGLVLEANFNDRQRLEFENKLEMKLGFITAPSDTVHEYKTNADLFRLNSKLGVKAFKNWYYTLAAEFKTQFFANYKTNSNDLNSSFLSPAQLDVTLGMDFKQNKKNYSLSLLGSPLAYSFIYIGNDEIVDPSAFNVKDGHRTANLFGSKFTGNLKWTIIPSIVWESKLEYFTTYDQVIANWENTFNFVLNRYLSTKLFVHARFDDGVTLADDNHSYFQLQELLSFGINYTW